MSLRQISLAEVKKHKSKNSVWIVVHNDVLDVTKFLDEHPGGVESIMEMAGKDATQAFDDVGHSHDARQLTQKYKIGMLPPGESRRPAESCCPGLSDRSKISTTKTWRSYDGSPNISHSATSRSSYRAPHIPVPEGRVQTIIVPRERTSNKWKWILLAVASAVVAGFVFKKFYSA